MKNDWDVGKMTKKQQSADLRVSELWDLDDLRRKWNETDVLIVPNHAGRRLVAGFACSDRAVEEALHLRYEVFNVELGHGIDASAITGLDRDEYDDHMTHLLLLESETRKIVGTYRLQTVSHALKHAGIYSAQEYDMSGFSRYFDLSVECGRACIAPEYRKAASLLILWTGLRAFMTLAGKRWLFGCCSISSHEPDDGWRALKTIRDGEFLDPELFVKATPDFSCGDPSREFDSDLGDAIPLPKLFSSYMRLGARVISEPAIDRAFGTIDFLVLADGLNVNMSKLGLTPPSAEV